VRVDRAGSLAPMTPASRLVAGSSVPAASSRPGVPPGSVVPPGPVVPPRADALPDLAAPGEGLASPLVVMTDPVCVCVFDVLERGACSASQLVAEVVRRLGPSAGGPAFIGPRVALLVAAGFAEASDPPPGTDPQAETVLAVADRRSDELLDALAEAVAEVRSAGDVQQEQDLVDALDVAWAARDGRRQGLRGVEEFRTSEAGRRHARRLAEGTLGQPGSPFAAE
jgi:hypothetical protein